MRSSTVEVLDEEDLELNYNDKIIKLPISNPMKISPTLPQIQTNPDYQKDTNEHTYEYIKGIIEKGFLASEGIKFYFAGILTGYNIGFTSAIKDTTKELSNMAAEVEKLEQKIDQINKDITELKVEGAKTSVSINHIEELLAEIKTSTDDISNIKVSITELNGKIKNIEDKLEDRKKGWRVWIPTFVTSACTILAVLITFWLGKH